MRSFGSDNHSGVHPKIWQALAEANRDHAPSYGTDRWCEEAEKLFAEHFGAPVDVFFVFNGTGANVLSLSGLVQSYESVLASESSHLNVDECAAPEITGRVKLQTVKSPDGKVHPEHIEEHLIRRGDQHYVQLRAVSLTQPTEHGTLYTIEEMREIGKLCRQHDLFFHVDGARFIIAAERLGVSLKELSRDLGVDVLSFGGTKNGLLMGEAVLVFHPHLRNRYKYLRKQMMQLPSKSRFIGAQFAALLKDDLWREISRHSCEMATRLAAGLKAYPQVRLTQPTQCNAVFACLPQSYVASLRKHYFFYVWNEKTFEVRLMTSFDTSEDDINGLLTRLQTLG